MFADGVGGRHHQTLRPFCTNAWCCQPIQRYLLSGCTTLCNVCPNGQFRTNFMHHSRGRAEAPLVDFDPSLGQHAKDGKAHPDRYRRIHTGIYASQTNWKYRPSIYKKHWLPAVGKRPPSLSNKIAQKRTTSSPKLSNYHCSH
jgi:hypothetical protein